VLAMQQDTGKLKKSALNLREHLSALERDWLSGCLVSNVGVKVAIYSDRDPQQLVVEYDSKLMNGTDLLDILHLRGVRAELRTADLASKGP
jgi:hypothetical protein